MWTLIKLILRRDRVKLPVWIGVISLSLLSMIPVLQKTYGDQSSIDVLYQTFSVNPAGLFLTGPVDAPTFGALVTIETLLWWGLAIAFMSTLLIVRHTRHNEETGAQELLLSGQIRRSSSLVAALIVAVAANIVMGLVIGGGLVLIAGEYWSPEHSWLFGAALALFGIVWSAIAAAVAQLFENTRLVNGVLAGLIGIAFVARGIGDFMGKVGSDGLLQPAWISSLSPFGWLQATRPLTFPDWSPLTTSLAVALAVSAVAFLLLARRDVGMGLVPARKGRTRASKFRRTGLGLTWHLQRNIAFGWLVGVLAMVGTIGIMTPEMTNIYDSSDSIKMLVESLGGQGALIPAFLSAMLAIIILMVVAYALQGLGKLRDEESSGHLESLLATKLSRRRWAMLHIGTVVVTSVIMLALTGCVMALGVNLLTDIEVSVAEYTLAGLSYGPIVLLFAGLYLLLFGIVPRVAGLVTWAYFGVVVFMTWLAPVMDIDKSIMNISILEHLPASPAEDIKLAPMLWITGIALLLVVIGFTAWSRRNLIER